MAPNATRFPAPDGGEALLMRTAAQWRRWLAANHTKRSDVWLVTYKKSSGKPRLEHEAAVEEAICFGWIDSKSKGVDEERTSLYFTPRRPTSRWTEGNIARAERLIAAGRMAPAGLSAYARRG